MATQVMVKTCAHVLWHPAQVRARALDQTMRGVGFEPLSQAGPLGMLSQEQLEKTVAG